MSSQPVPRAARNPWIVTALIAFLCIAWGSTWLAIKWGLEDLPPFSAASARFGIAWLVMAAVAPSIARREGGSRPELRLVLVSGIGQFTLSYGIVYWTEQTLPSGLVSVLWSVFPLMVAGLGAFMLAGERLVARQWLGLCVALGGIVLLFLTDVRAVGAEAVPAGLVLMLSPLVTAIATVYIKRHAARVSSAMLNRDSMGIGAAGLLIAALLFERDREYAWTAQAWGSILYLAIFGTVLTFGLYLWLMRWVPAYKMSLIAYVTPVNALFLGVMLGDEKVGALTLVGSGVVLLGVACTVMRRRDKVRLAAEQAT